MKPEAQAALRTGQLKYWAAVRSGARKSAAEERRERLLSDKVKLADEIDMLTEERARLTKEVDALRAVKKHTPLQLVSRALTNRTLLTEEEIVAGAGEVPGYSGVYFLVSLGKVMYVGQSTNVNVRIASHISTKVFDSVAWVPCTEDKLDALESLYIHCLRPPLNGRNTSNEYIRAPLSLAALLEE